MLIFFVGLFVGLVPLQQYKYDVCKDNNFKGVGCKVEQSLCLTTNDDKTCGVHKRDRK